MTRHNIEVATLGCTSLFRDDITGPGKSGYCFVTVATVVIVHPIWRLGLLRKVSMKVISNIFMLEKYEFVHSTAVT